MEGLLALAVQALARNAAARARATARRATLLAVAGLCLLLALGFLTAAGWTALALWQGSLRASLIFAGGFLLLALLVWLIARRRPRPPASTSSDIEAMQAQAQALLAQAPDVVARYPALPLLVAFLGGLAAALRLRR